MILNNNPAINVDELMKRVREAAEQIRTSGAIEFRRGEPRNQDEIRLAQSLDRHRIVTRLLDGAEAATVPLGVPRRLRAFGALGAFITRVFNYFFKRQREYNGALLATGRELISLALVTGDTLTKTIENLAALETYRMEAFRELRESIDGLRSQLAGIENSHHATRQLAEGVRADLDAAQIAHLAIQTRFAHERVDTAEATLRDVSLRANASPLREEVERSMLGYLRDADRRIADNYESALRSIAMLRGEVQALPRAAGLAPADPPAVAPDPDDAFHAYLSDRFRGSRPDIETRLAEYLPIVQAAGTITAETPLLDIGPGRGEWLTVLREHGIPAFGAETNRLLADECAALGFDVRCEDMLGVLRSLPAASLGALTAFHVVEHISFPYLLEALREAMRVLVPGGTIVFETPNSRNILVATVTFYFDPTHRNPVPHELLTAVLEGLGYADCRVLELHRLDPPIFPGNDELSEHLNARFFSAQDYALIARTPYA
uniref:Methyltransferase type 11 domain-containing protein n=1 Tax=uncultured organism TaxID=155900 RepID=A0A7L9QC13_9ZZZZ|nr:hypothetical protein [uncultured organism]